MSSVKLLSDAEVKERHRIAGPHNYRMGDISAHLGWTLHRVSNHPIVCVRACVCVCVYTINIFTLKYVVTEVMVIILTRLYARFAA